MSDNNTMFSKVIHRQRTLLFANVAFTTTVFGALLMGVWSLL